MKPVLKTNEVDLVDRIGLDATIFLRFTRMLRNLFLALSLIGLLITIPVNVSLSNDSIKEKGNGFSLLTPQFIFGNAWWSHVVCSWAFDIILAYFLWHNYRRVRHLRRAYFESPEYQMSLHARTLLVTDIPSKMRSDEGILRVTDDVNPSGLLPRASIGRNVKVLPKLIEEHEETVRKLESVLSKYLRNPDNLPAKRPTMRPPRKFKGDRPEGRVDSIEYLTNRIRELEQEIRDVRDRIDKRDAMPYGFASWEQIETAHAVAFSARGKHPEGTTIVLAPRPNDLIWENLPLGKAARKAKRLANMAWVTFLTLLWTPLNACIAIFVSNLANLGRVWPAFQTSLSGNPTGWAIVQGIASPAITSLVYLVLPIIFRRLSIRAGDMTKTSRERHVIHDLYAFFCFNNLIVFSLFSAIWTFVSATLKATDSGDNAWDAIQKGQFYNHILISLCTVSPFWVTWLLQRNLGAAVDLAQVFNLFVVWFARTFMSPTPRQNIEWTAPPPFDYASYYNYFLFYATVALCFATLQPIVLPVTAFYFCLDSWLKKYLLMYVFVTKTESGGQMWRILYNRMIFAAILANIMVALVVKARGTWAMIGVMAPLPFLMLGFKWYCKKTFDDDIHYYVRTGMRDGESLTAGSKPKKVGDRVLAKFGHPALHRPLITPMVHAKAKHVLGQVYRGRLNSDAGKSMAYSDIALEPMSGLEAGKPSAKAGRDVAPFEIVPEGQQDFTFFRNRADFKEEFSGGIYGRPEDLISERSQTPLSFTGHGTWSPENSSRASSPSPTRAGLGSPRGDVEAVGNDGVVRPIPRKPFDQSNVHPAFRNQHYRSGSSSPHRTSPYQHPTSRGSSVGREIEAGDLGTRPSPSPYTNSAADESETRLLGNVEVEGAATGDDWGGLTPPPTTGENQNPHGMERWRTEGSSYSQQQDDGLGSYDYYRGRGGRQ
jgi:calcium permeable stress-gated cation channel